MCARLCAAPSSHAMRADLCAAPVCCSSHAMRARLCAAPLMPCVPACVLLLSCHVCRPVCCSSRALCAAPPMACALSPCGPPGLISVPQEVRELLTFYKFPGPPLPPRLPQAPRLLSVPVAPLVTHQRRGLVGPDACPAESMRTRTPRMGSWASQCRLGLGHAFLVSLFQAGRVSSTTKSRPASLFPGGQSVAAGPAHDAS